MNRLITKFLKDFNYINNYYNLLVDMTKKQEYVGITNEWIIDNFYLLVEHKVNIIHDKKIINKRLYNTIDIYYCLKELALHNNFNIDFKMLSSEIKKYQKDNNMYFTYDQIASIKNLLLFIYTEKLHSLCIEEMSKLNINKKISKLIGEVKDNENVSISTFFNDKDLNNLDHYYVFELNNQLKNLGTKSNGLFKEINEMLKEKQISLKDVINEEHQKKIDSNLLISNIFQDLKEFFEFSDEELLEKTSSTEKLLLEDKIYKQMTVESKYLYRKQVAKLAKKHKMNEYLYLLSIIDKNVDDDYHIGFSLFKKKNTSLRVVLYILSLVLLTFITCFYLSKYFIKFRVLGFLILLIPVSQLFIQLINRLLIKVVATNPLPKLNYTKGIPDESATMVVIPTIVSSKEKIKTMFSTLETFYLMNKSDNLYFTLLGDVKASDKEVEDYDKEISEYGEKISIELNKKYGKDLFYFVYRKRKWNDKENSYLGYERKRGALLQFNKILLKEMSDSEEKKWFNVNTLHHHNLDIKYVITLDSDTKLVLNTALNLIGAMAHPLNRPVLNKEGTKVISGYGIMQPRVSVDIEATNKSLYSQIFAGIGGFDTYSALIPDVYQDTFLEGSFVGKGIYDLKVFDQILDGVFPDNLILSHDLLEGNYLRCGYVSDIELVDDFPAKFLTDTSRHHRWARGDTQIISWLGNRVRNKKGDLIKNPINILGKFKILDNIVRIFYQPLLLVVLLLAVCCPKVNAWWWVGFVVLAIAIPVIFFLKNKLIKEESHSKTVYYKNLVFGGRSLILKCYITLATIPFYTKLYLDAFFRTIYRLTVSHKNLLNWVTAEDAEKTLKSDLITYIKNFYFNIGVSVVFIILGIIFKEVVAFIIALVFISAPFILYYVSLTIPDERVDLKEDEDEDVKKLAYETWLYFKDNLRAEYFYLIPDNYQENREEKLDMRTSPTAIGFSLVSIVSAYELEFIKKDEALELIEKVLDSVSKLEKWHGHLYNWYSIKTGKVINPRFVSTVDSGNFVSSLIVVREFLYKLGDEKLVKLCDKLIRNTNFRKLYTKKHVFSIGYDDNEGKLSIYNYNKFASESRLTSYLAICLGDVSSKHWFSLDKSLTTYKGRKGLISWSGTAFEYYMPLLFMKNYPNTLLDESYKFSYLCQKDYVAGVSRKLPWGISESAYNELDNSLNYKYRAFATPYLKAKESSDNRIVLAPYASLMVMELFPRDVYKNILKFRELDMTGKYGLYEAYDYDNKGVVEAFFAHHQGMILAGLTNYLKDGAIKNYFHHNVNIKTYDILLKEKVQVKADIDMKMADYKKYNYAKEGIENDIRYFNYISYMPEVSVLSNRKYALLMNDRGDSFSRYRTLQLNRYRKVTEQDYGMFMYIKDLDTDYVWSNTYAPVNKKCDNYEVVFASDNIKYIRKDGVITTKTEIIVMSSHHGEIRKVTFRNNSDEVKSLELTTYTEVILSPNMDDVSHRVFNSMFITSEFDKKSNSLIMKRRSRGDAAVNSYMFNRLLIEDPLEDYSYETERYNFVGRGRTVNDPVMLDNKLTNYVGDNLDPVMSIRNKILIGPNSSTTVYYIAGFGRSREQINDIIESYNDKKKIDNAFKVATLNNIVNTKMLSITGSDMRLYNIMLNYLYQTTKISVSEERNEILRQNALGQNALWKFGVSGDRPIILVDISDISDLPFVFSILKTFEYYKNNSIFVDIVIINDEKDKYAKIINKEIDDEIYRMYSLNNFYHTPGMIKVIDGNSLSSEERILFNVVPRLKFIIKDHMTLESAISDLQEHNKISNYEEALYERNVESKIKEKIVFDNGYGGFVKDGEEYLIYNRNTPTPWSNVISNKNFGTIVTNNGCGYTFAYNSGEFKITSWTNDIVVNDQSEGFKFDNRTFVADKCRHGFGYSILESETSEVKKEICEFVAVEDTVKLYLVKLTNKTKKKIALDVSYYINPVLGNFEEKTARHILAEYIDRDDYVKLRNVYSINYSDVVVCMAASMKLTDSSVDRILSKSISTKVELEPLEEKEMVFMLGASRDNDYLEMLLKKYRNVESVKREFKDVVSTWKEKLSVVKVKTPDVALDYVLNGWYLYQTISSRLFAKAGFYQVSGAYGYRDQLQDAMNIVLVDPSVTYDQILRNASHQFVEGDVLHWWHEDNHFGLRSRYKDDYLWLVYATIMYIEVTGDVAILSEEVPYINAPILGDYENEKTVNFEYTSDKDSLFKHLEKALNLSINSLGSHHLPLMGGGDWNDGMNRVGIKGKGESVWLGFFLYNIIEMFIPVIEKFDSSYDISKLEKFNSKLKDNLNKYGWDDKYYLRAYFDNGDRLGSHDNTECKIDLISQSFALISGVCPEEKKDEVLSSVSDNLVDEEHGLVKLLTPPFSKSLNNPGYIMNYSKGIRENGGQYTHAVSWYIMALIKEKKYDEAYRYYQMINPVTKNNIEEYKVEPYVIAADIYSATNMAGRGGWTWYTGSAGWFYNVGIRNLLGIKKEGSILNIEPCVLDKFKKFNITYRYLDTTYDIEVIKDKTDKILVDGTSVSKIKLVNDKKKHDVVIYRK